MPEPASSLLLKAVRSLDFSKDRTDLLRSVPPGQWEDLLRLTDDARMTLPLVARCQNAIPEPVRRRLDGCIARNAARHAGVVETHARIAEAMARHGAEFLVLKGLTHGRLWFGNSFSRPQYDVDLYCPPASIQAAIAAAESLGYEPVELPDHGVDHLPVMIRRTGWRWRGDYYDADQPLALELHHRFWNPALGFAVHGEDRFWRRRMSGVFDGVVLPALHPGDSLDYAAWHAVRHLLRGSLRICHIYELAHFLDHMAENQEYWREWREQGAPADRLAESIAFRLAEEWFGCRLNPVVAACTRALPARVERWFRLFAFSPITAIGHPNKDELILNLCLAQNTRDRCRIAARRIFPALMPVRLPDAHVRGETPQMRSNRTAQTARFIARRVLHHLMALSPVIRSGLRWWFPDRWRKPSLET